MRNESGMTQSEIAKALMISQNSISYWESGERSTEPNIVQLKEIANLFGITVDKLLSEDVNEEESESNNEIEDFIMLYKKIFILLRDEDCLDKHFNQGFQHAVNSLNYSADTSISDIQMLIQKAITEFKEVISLSSLRP